VLLIACPKKCLIKGFEYVVHCINFFENPSGTKFPITLRVDFEIKCCTVAHNKKRLPTSAYRREKRSFEPEESFKEELLIAVNRYL
jgi:hypothetical protein